MPDRRRPPRAMPTRTPSGASGSRGFTLLELILTVVILAIVLALGVPAFTDTIRQNRMTAQANDLQALMLLARVEAIKRGVDVEVELSRAAGSDGWLAHIVDPADPAAALRRVEQDGTPVTLGASWSAVDDTWTVVFNPLGQRVQPLGAGDTRLSLQHGNCTRSQRRELMIERSGRIFIDVTPASRACWNGGGDA